MNRLIGRIAVLAIFPIFAGACEAPLAGPDVDPAFAKGANGGGKACPLPATVVVSDEDGFRSALASASPGDVIAIDGTIELAEVNVWVQQSDVTITCATEGSGIATGPDFTGFTLLVLLEPGITVTGISIDASAAGRPMGAWNSANVLQNAVDITITDNHFTCGTSSCVFVTGVDGLTVEGNTMVASQSNNSGFHIQGNGPYNPDGSRAFSARNVSVVGNTVITDFVSRIASFGGIRLHSVIGAVVSQNRVIGQWQNSFAPTQTWDLVASGNRFEGAVNYAIGSGFNTSPFGGVSLRSSTIRNNQGSGAGIAGAFFLSACGNTLVGNQLKKNGDGTSVIFDAATGANTLAGGGGTVVDNGDFDCDGDGSSDPNVIGGAGAVLHGVSLGGLISDDMAASDAGVN